MVFYRRHLCRLDPWPEAMQQTADELDGNQVYLTMNGPTEFDVIGEALRDWDRTADLGRITNPTLVTCGRYDEITPACSETLAAGHPGRADGRVRVERALRAPRGDAALHGRRGGVPRPVRGGVRESVQRHCEGERR